MFEPMDMDIRPHDDLYAERVDAFVYRYLSDIKAFSEREQRPYEETRKMVAESFCKYLFQSSSSDTPMQPDQHAQSMSTISI
jgi:hypothetical protein